MSASKRLNDNGVLTESGTNEFEMLSFELGNCVYGVNVSKVREIINYTKITPLPGADDRIMGVIMPRDEILTVIDLKYALFGTPSEHREKDYFIVCHFNGKTMAFLVNNVKDIKRYNWNDIVSPENIVSGSDGAKITGLIKTEQEIISVLDFERIMTEINISNGLTVEDVENLQVEEIEKVKKQHIKVLVADDSKMLNKLISDSVTKAGYEVHSYFDGETAYNALLNNVKLNEDGQRFDVVISDIEMPQMDGMRFCRLCKEDDRLINIPFILFSSLIDKQMLYKCQSVGANAALTKPELGNLIEIVNKLVKDAKNNKLETMNVDEYK